MTSRKMADKECAKIGPSTETIVNWQERSEATNSELWTLAVSTRVLNEEEMVNFHEFLNFV